MRAGVSGSDSTGPQVRAWLLLATYLLFALEHAATASDEIQNRPSIEIGWTEVPPQIDGRLDPEEWSNAAYVDGLTQATPDEGQTATERTEVWIMTDKDHLYIAARLLDRNPEEIIANIMRRDKNITVDDRFGFTIDPFLDRQNGYFFQVNPNGSRRDALIEGLGFETSWDGRWYAKTSVDEKGWIVEIALPYASINFDPNANVWGLNMARGIRRRNEIDRWSDPVLERFLTAMGRAGNLVGMKGVEQGSGLQVTPAATLRRVDDANDPGEGNDRRHYTRFDPSFDLFSKLTPSVTTSLTVNTDFGESEVDARQVNLSRFALFFPEQRDFFLQDGLIFNFADLLTNGRPFFSRRIGLSETGEPEGILAGGKVTGRLGPIKFGVLDVVLDEHDRVDQQNVLVARAAANIGESTIGAIVTNGDPTGISSNTVVGADFNYRNSDFLDNKSFDGNLWVQGSFSDPDTGPTLESDLTKGTGLAYGGTLRYPNDRVNWFVSANTFENDFNPALGFANRIGIRDYKANIRRRWRPDRGPFQTVDTILDGNLVTGFSDTVETGRVAWAPLDLTSPIGDGIRFQYVHRYEFVETDFTNLEVSKGRYHFDEGEILFRASRNRWIGGEAIVGYGSFFDGTRTRASTDLILQFSRYVRVGVIYSINDIDLPDGDELIHLMSTRLSLLFTPDISWITLVQFDTVSDTIGINSRFRWIIEDGREVFLVFNQGLDTSDGLRAGRSEPLIKLKWTFRF